MLSHACASCGKMLDESSRTYSRAARLWVAQCPRCGFAVRWAPRAAREPARAWARLRALNLRIGISLGAMQAGAVALVITGAIVEETVRLGGPGLPQDALIDWLAPTVIAATVTGCIVALAAATVAPFRSLYASFLGAWTGTALIASILGILVSFAASGGPMRLVAQFRTVIERGYAEHPLTRIALLTAIAASVVAAPLLRIVVRTAFNAVVRNSNRARRQTSSARRHPLPRPIGANP
jgi:hypothetical protein